MEQEQITDLIVIRQLPIIEEQLQKIKTEVKQDVNNAMSLECTEDTVKLVKAQRTALSNKFKDFEERRKDVKGKILAPYEAFDKVYKECITDVFTPADAELKRKIDDVENNLKNQKAAKVKTYFDEYKKTLLGIDFITYKDSGIHPTLSITLKKLKEQAKMFLDKCQNDIALIDSQEYRDEILVEYKKNLNVSLAITTVTKRHKAIEEERKRIEQINAERKKRKNAIAKVLETAKEEKASEPVEQIFTPPVSQPIKEAPVAPEPEETGEVYECTFTVQGTITQIRELKKYLIERGLING